MASLAAAPADRAIDSSIGSRMYKYPPSKFYTLLTRSLPTRPKATPDPRSCQSFAVALTRCSDCRIFLTSSDYHVRASPDESLVVGLCQSLAGGVGVFKNYFYTVGGAMMREPCQRCGSNRWTAIAGSLPSPTT